MAENEAVVLNQQIVQLEEELKRLRTQVGRRRLPDTRQAITHKFDIAGHEGYLTIGTHDDGYPGEVFITMAKEGSTIGGLLDTVGALMSLNLQYGTPLEVLVSKFAYVRFEPSGLTKNPDISIAKSIIDYIVRWMAYRFIPGYRDESYLPPPHPELNLTMPTPPPADPTDAGTPVNTGSHVVMEATPTCDTCGAITVHNGGGYRCLNCGSTIGCS